ncbi:MAG: AAA family ATPase [Lachnospiraceae bacterium]|nr:AAA family ATPase [Lachnospiraceae bacterium]
MIIYLTGKSASGKDSIASELLKRIENVTRYIPYTTRPRRSHEVDGREYHFITTSELEKLETDGRVIENRTYNTIHGPWTYATVDDFDSHSNVLMVGTIESFKSIQEKMGADEVKGLYIECSDGDRLQRALDREKKEEAPKYKEMCRRFLADEEDYSEEKIKEAAVDRVFRNDDLKSCVGQIEDYIKSCL